jgi:hypothetical protein
MKIKHADLGLAESMLEKFKDKKRYTPPYFN